MISQLHNGPFGSCCKDLKDAMTVPPNSFFFVEKNNVFFLTIGYAQTDKGRGSFPRSSVGMQPVTLLRLDLTENAYGQKPLCDP